MEVRKNKELKVIPARSIDSFRDEENVQQILSPRKKGEALLNQLGLLKQATITDFTFITATQTEDMPDVIKSGYLAQDVVDGIHGSQRQGLEQSFVNLYRSKALQRMSHQNIIPFNSLTVLHHADLQIYEQEMKRKNENLEEWPFID